jgi:hypothetical protein
VENIDQLLEVKTRLTTIKGYAQLLEREIERTQPRSDKLDAQVEELNREIARLVKLVGTIEASMTAGAGAPPPADL